MLTVVWVPPSPVFHEETRQAASSLRQAFVIGIKASILREASSDLGRLKVYGILHVGFHVITQLELERGCNGSLDDLPTSLDEVGHNPKK